MRTVPVLGENMARVLAAPASAARNHAPSEPDEGSENRSQRGTGKDEERTWGEEPAIP